MEARLGTKLAALAVLALAATGAAAAVPEAMQRITAPDGRERHYQMTLPERLRGQRAPVLFVLHGGGGSARQVHRSWSFDVLARRKGFVVVYPDGVDRHWNDGRSGGSAKLFKGPAPDDTGFLRALAAKLVRDGVADAGRLYVTGVSNGGMMTQRLACAASDVFAGFASVIANLPASLRACRPFRPRTVLMINGDADPLMPWKGGGVGFRGKRGAVLSGPATFAHWKKAAGCTGPVVTKPLPDRDKSDGARPERISATGCPPGVRIAMIRIHGGGHTVPGRPHRARRLRRLLGHTSMDFDARDMIVQELGL